MHNISQVLRQNYDHFAFPGAVPRTFVGALSLTAASRPILFLTKGQHAQFVVRAVLGLFNAWALLRYKHGLTKAFGKGVGRWYILLQATQFHVIYYASRTLPNMFAFGLSELPLCCAEYPVTESCSHSCTKRILARGLTPQHCRCKKEEEAGYFTAGIFWSRIQI